MQNSSAISKTTLSPASWMDMDFDLDQLDPDQFPWRNMSKYDLSKIQWRYNEQKYYSTLSIIDLLIRTFLYIAGMIGHSLILIVLSDKEFQTATFQLLRFLSISDIVFCSSMWLMGCMEFRLVNSSNFGLMFFYTHIVKNIRGAFGYFSGFLSMALAGDRIAAVWFFYTYAKIPNKKKEFIMKILTIALLAVSAVGQVGWSISIGVGSLKNSRAEESFVYVPKTFYLDGRGQAWEKYTTTYYGWFVSITMFIASFLTLWGMIRLQKYSMPTQGDKDQRKRELRTAFISFFLDAVIILWWAIDQMRQLLFASYSFMTVRLDYSNTYEQASDVLKSLDFQTFIKCSTFWVWTLSHSWNFYLYLALHRRFRRVFRSKLCANRVVQATSTGAGSGALGAGVRVQNPAHLVHG